MVCLVPSLPATLFAHPFPRHVRQCLAPIKSSLTSRWLGLLLPICSCHLICSPSPHRVLLHGWLAGWGVDSWMVWVLIECESPVTSPHHAPHAAWLALGVFPPSLFFLCLFFLVLFFGGLGGRESWLGLWPPSCHHR